MVSPGGPDISVPQQDASPEDAFFAGEVDLLPPRELDRPLWKSLLSNLRDTFSPESLPPLRLSSAPLDVGMLLGDRLSIPWFRTVFTNIGDVISPESLPPLVLESRPLDAGELISDQLSHLWFSSLLRNLADQLVPDRQPPLDLTSKPEDAILPSQIMLLPKWSSVISTPKVFLPDQPKPAAAVANQARVAGAPLRPLPKPVAAEIEFLRTMENDLKRDLSRSRLRARIWMALATAQILFLLGSTFWPK